MSKKILKWGEIPFLVPKTERVEGEQYPNEGLHEGIVYLTPVEDKESKNGKPAYNNGMFILNVMQGYIKDNRIIFQPQDVSSFHGSAFCFNRPQSEKDDSEQQRLLGEWAKNYCICVLDCSSHKQLKFITDNLDGKYINKRSNLTITTKPNDVDEETKNAFLEWKAKVEEGYNFEDALDEFNDERKSDLLRNNNLVIDFRNEPPKLRKNDRDLLYSEPSTLENAPENFPDLSEYTKVTTPTTGNSGNKYQKGGGYSPAQRYDFIVEKLKEAGIKGDNAYDIMLDAMSEETKFMTLNFVLCATGCQPLNK